jgi:hypothetical protein
MSEVAPFPEANVWSTPIHDLGLTIAGCWPP